MSDMESGREIAEKFMATLLALATGKLQPEGSSISLPQEEPDKEMLQGALDELDDFAGYLDALIDTVKGSASKYPLVWKGLTDARVYIALARGQLVLALESIRLER